ncbi:cytochrome c oxidase assembly protein [Sphingosinicella rhizophila]|uniref:Cytochrome c oxidase assembly protein CtaG n=1 Tax=Sphingosinicella rhizophila TaxID=3050082 RepID=A0ABU3Q8U0_9SPHN|nr:cytochrome c oxidase assembly protein [Sphingosinicella sp. GR2756]MDT9599398.1 cytochrome c oxidase assembly protein [Sphingosinicella sp. GR2756]
MNRNLRTAAFAAFLVCGMTGLAFASVPLYRIFCQVTGFAGTPQRADEVVVKSTGKLVWVRFDANTSSALPWQFEPEEHRERVAIGARDMAFFSAKNLSDKPITGTATFNVTPINAGKYFTKVQCFCFSEQTLKAGEDVRMPVVFQVDPAILEDPDTKDISEITLSYTFYPVDQPKG